MKEFINKNKADIIFNGTFLFFFMFLFLFLTSNNLLNSLIYSLLIVLTNILLIIYLSYNFEKRKIKLNNFFSKQKLFIITLVTFIISLFVLKNIEKAGCISFYIMFNLSFLIKSSIKEKSQY